MHREAVYVALMGVTGSGKSSFIKTVTESTDVEVGHGLESSTEKVCTYPCKIKGQQFVFVDTPGFNDTTRDEFEVLQEISTFLADTFAAGTKLSAVLYLHPITNSRVQGTGMNNLRMFKAICGADFQKNVVLATTFNTHVSSSIKAARLKELKETSHFWGHLIQQGSTVIELPQERDACVELVLGFVTKKAKAMKLQVEQASGLDIGQTTAGKLVRDMEALKKLEAEGKAAVRKEKAVKKQQIKEAQRKHEHELAARLKELKLTQEREDQAQRRKEDMAIDKRRRDQRRDHYRSLWNLTMISRLNFTYTTQFADLVPNSCDRCDARISSDMTYRCYKCNTGEGYVDLCARCHSRDIGCYDSGHELARVRYAGSAAGGCRRMRHPPGSRHRIPCSRCKKLLANFYFHCCYCETDNFDMCLNCAVSGGTCRNKYHILQLLSV